VAYTLIPGLVFTSPVPLGAGLLTLLSPPFRAVNGRQIPHPLSEEYCKARNPKTQGFQSLLARSFFVRFLPVMGGRRVNPKISKRKIVNLLTVPRRKIRIKIVFVN
jgi:hypothetical protein